MPQIWSVKYFSRCLNFTNCNISVFKNQKSNITEIIPHRIYIQTLSFHAMFTPNLFIIFWKSKLKAVLELSVILTADDLENANGCILQQKVL